jgi:hypothetical protein
MPAKISREAYNAAPRWVIAYIGATIDDARKVNGVWCSDQKGRILRLNLQHAVRTLCSYDGRCAEVASAETERSRAIGS